MLKNQGKKITITGQSVVTIKEGEASKELAVERYSCTIDSEHPENMTVSKFYPNVEAREAYTDHRTECRADYAEFQAQAYELQDAMFAEQQVSEV